MTVKRKRGLGKGLEALLGSGSAGTLDSTTALPLDIPTQTALLAESDNDLKYLPLEQLQRGRFQPRLDIDPERLEELANSIRQQGVIQPIVVRPLETPPNRYEIIAGERRWRAAQLAGIEQIPALIRPINDQAAIAISLIENIQREELNPIEEAQALQRLIDEFGLTHQQSADAIGRSRASVTNLLRLLSLQSDVKQMVENGDLEMGHARALLTLEQPKQLTLAREVADRRLSVRETEKRVKELQQPPPKKAPKADDPDVKRLEQTLAERIGASVAIQQGGQGKGKVVIRYNSLDELEGILAHIQ
ncbi:ParB/RepB/Spo0J family partition protein [Ectothiorhodospiraceae bacterium BW-2]|nr:ParB/RepB/Spo0J family partition protein [Ectothiorhodospiraceae bacterium BW-2]